MRRNRTRWLTDEVLVDVVGSSSDHSNFAEQGEGDSVDPAHEAVDLLVAAGLLLAELVAGEGEHVEVGGAEVALQLLQLFVVLVRVAALAGDVHHQGHLEPKKHTVVSSPPLRLQVRY